MAQLNSIIVYLNKLLKPEDFNDSAYNGLQVESPRQEISRIAFAVDAGLAVIEEAIAQDANLLVVHHGLLWGVEQPLSGVFGAKIELLMRSRCSLYASHLPLDAHPEVGNAFELGRFFSLEELTPFFEYNGSMIGARANLPAAIPLEFFTARAAEMTGATNQLVLPFGPNEVRSVGIVTGSGSSALEACAAEGIDLLISGEPKHEVYHRAKEHKINALFGGHYATETFGVLALSRRLKDKFKVDTIFIDEPTGI